MSINNWLCKHFDVNEKGYVTIEDVKDKVLDLLETFLICVVVGIVGAGIIYVLIRGILFILNDDIHNSEEANIIGFGGVLLLMIIFVIGLGLFYGQYKNTKIAKCELRREHDQR